MMMNIDGLEIHFYILDKTTNTKKASIYNGLRNTSNMDSNYYNV